jgi:hypothetical protein
MEKEFVPYELALRMKTLGFNENCYRVGNPNGAICWRFMDVAGVEGVGIDDILLEKFDKLWWVEIPTYSQAFRWFRKEYGIFVSIVPNKYGSLDSFIGWIYIPLNGSTKDIDVGGRKGYNTPEEAELACLEKLIEIVESKKE